MIVRDRSYPHPVLSPFRDDVHPNEFSLEVEVDHDADAYYLDLVFRFDNPTIADLIGAGVATCAAHIECKHNYYRQLFHLEGQTGRIRIGASELKGRVQVSGFVLALQAIRDYSISGAHDDYAGAVFDIQPGDPLAVGYSVQFDAYLDYDPLTRISSILTIVQSEEQATGPLHLDFDDERLIATLSQEDYAHYTELKGDKRLGALLANQVVVPAVLEAIHLIKSVDADDYENHMTQLWFRSIVKKSEELGLDIRSSDVEALQVTQALLKLPLRRSLTSLLDATAEEED